LRIGTYDVVMPLMPYALWLRPLGDDSWEACAKCSDVFPSSKLDF